MLLLFCLFFTSFSLHLSKGEPSQVTWKLTVSSAHGDPNPSVGDHYYADGEKVVCGIPIFAVDNGSYWECAGYFGSGSVSDFGWATSFSFVIHEDSVIRWDWHQRVFPPANSSTTLAFAESSYPFKVGEPFNVSVTLQNVSEITTWQIALIFDPNIIEYSGVSIPADNIFAGQNVILGGPYTREVDEGYVKLGLDAGPGGVPFNGSGNLCTFTFVGKNAGNAFLKFRAYRFETFLLGGPMATDLSFVMTESSAHSVFLKTDVNDDGVVNMKDVSLAASAFNSMHGSHRWNIADDVDGSGRVDMRDIAAIVLDFGKTDPNHQAGVVIYKANTNFYNQNGTLKIDIDIGDSGTEPTTLIALYVGTSTSTMVDQMITPVTVAPGQIGRITIDFDWRNDVTYFFRIFTSSGLAYDWVEQAPIQI